MTYQVVTLTIKRLALLRATVLFCLCKGVKERLQWEHRVDLCNSTSWSWRLGTRSRTNSNMSHCSHQQAVTNGAQLCGALFPGREYVVKLDNGLSASKNGMATKRIVVRVPAG